MKMRLLILVVAVVGVLRLEAQTDSLGCRLSTDAFVVTVGSAHRADTYLSPIRYSGFELGLRYSHARRFAADSLLWILDVGIDADRTLNRARNAVMLGAQFGADWTLMRFWRPSAATQVGVGGATSLTAGALYVRRNGNNPVAANASLTVGPAVYGAWRFNVGRLPVTALYRATLPLAGVMFTPDYGQLYYEFYLGDTRGMFGAAYPGRYFRLAQTLTADLTLGRRNLRVGYGLDIASTKVNGIVSRRISHLFIVGITAPWFR